MELSNEFLVHVPIARAWAVLTDVETIAPCLPGAQLEEVEGDEYRGGVKIKVGPITAAYKGKATFLEKDDVNHIAKLRGEGRDSKGQGNASVTITMRLTDVDGSSTKVNIHNDLSISGKVAQFARASVLSEVSEKLLNQFVNCLEHDVLTRPEETLTAVADASASIDAAATSAASATTSVKADPSAASSASAASASSASSASDSTAESTKPSVRKIEYKAAEPVDLLDAAGSPILKRLAPVAAVVLVLLLLWRRRK
jgi:uncharacterized protein